MSRDKPTLRERVARALATPEAYLPRRDGEPREQWQARAVQFVVDRHVTYSHPNQRRIGLLWPTDKAYAYLARFGPTGPEGETS